MMTNTYWFPMAVIDPQNVRPHESGTAWRAPSTPPGYKKGRDVCVVVNKVIRVEEVDGKVSRVVFEGSDVCVYDTARNVVAKLFGE